MKKVLVLCLVFLTYLMLPNDLNALLNSKEQFIDKGLTSPIITNLYDGKNTHTFKQAIYKTSDGDNAYCIHPGAKFWTGIYELNNSYDVSKCKNSLDAPHCGLAEIILRANNFTSEYPQSYNNDYFIILTALRLWNAIGAEDCKNCSLGDLNSDYWYDPETDQFHKYPSVTGGSNSTSKKANMFANVVKEIVSNPNYGSDGVFNIWSSDESISGKIRASIDLVKAVYNKGKGVSMYVPTIYDGKTHYTVETERYTMVFPTNIPKSDTSTKIESIEVNGVNYNSTVAPCTDNKNKNYLCINVEFLPNDEQKKNGFKAEAKIKYSNKNNILNKMGIYTAKSNPTNYQYMVLFDETTPDGSREFVLQNPKVTYTPTPKCGSMNGVWYDRNGNPVATYEEYEKSCGCDIEKDEDGNNIYYVGGERVSKEEYDELCTVPTGCPPEEPGDPNNPDLYDMPEECEKDGTTGTIKDSGICNILGSNDADFKNNYKTNYGHEGICDIYCRETYTFTFMDKEEAIAGRYFKHNVSAKYSTLEYLSTVVLASRQCASLTNYETWKQKYIAANDAVLSSWNQLKEWEAYYNLRNGAPTRTESGGGCSGCSCNGSDASNYYAYWENPNWLETTSNGRTISHNETYKINGGAASCDYSCCCLECDPPDEEGNSGGCSCTCGPCCGSCSNATDANLNIVTDTYNSKLSQYKNALKARDELLYKLQDCNFMTSVKKDDADLPTMYNIKPYYLTRDVTNWGANNATLKTYSQMVTNSKLKNELTIDYDENKVYREGYPVKIGTDLTPAHVTKMSFGDSSDWNIYCKDCDNDDLTNLNPTSFVENLSYWNCTGSELNGKCTNTGVNVPSNKITEIVINQESLHYQKAKLYTQVYTGIVKENKDGVADWIALDDHVYPVSLMRKSGDYGIYVKYIKFGNNDRNETINFKPGDYKCVYEVRNDWFYDCDDDYRECLPCVGEDCGSTTSLGVYFRSIDLANIFPGSIKDPNYNMVSTRTIGQNWNTDSGLKAIDQIQRIGNNIWTDITPEYRVILDSSTIKKIREYNNRTNYLDAGTLKCKDLYCTSRFLEETLKRDYLGNDINLYRHNTSNVTQHNYFRIGDN